MLHGGVFAYFCVEVDRCESLWKAVLFAEKWRLLQPGSEPRLRQANKKGFTMRFCGDRTEVVWSNITDFLVFFF